MHIFKPRVNTSVPHLQSPQFFYDAVYTDVFQTEVEKLRHSVLTYLRNYVWMLNVSCVTVSMPISLVLQWLLHFWLQVMIEKIPPISLEQWWLELLNPVIALQWTQKRLWVLRLSSLRERERERDVSALVDRRSVCILIVFSTMGWVVSVVVWYIIDYNIITCNCKIQKH